MIVDFLLIGSAKSATTSLSNGLSQHPDICFSDPKEPQFFSDANWKNNLKSYHALFKKKNAKLYGEGSTNYSKFPSYNNKIHQDIYDYNPNMKIIYMMRNPIERMVSHYVHSYNRGHEPIDNVNTALISNHHYLNTGRYAMQIEPYIKHFGRQNVLMLFFEDFISKPQSVLDTTFDFLGIQRVLINKKVLDSNKSFNRSIINYKYDNPKTTVDKIRKVVLILKNYVTGNFINQRPILSSETKAYILNNVKDDIKKIEELTDRNLSHWLD